MPYKNDTRKGDRHKKDTPRKDYHKPGSPDRHKGRLQIDRPWTGDFMSIDGEGWDGKYTLLACNQFDDDIYTPKGLTTLQCFEYLCRPETDPNNAYVGFGLSYDFENMLRDIPDREYKILLEGKSIEFDKYTLKYIPRKMLDICWNGKKICIQDVMGFYQSSFIDALKKWNIPIPPIIDQGKAMRNMFNEGGIDFIKAYNREELRLLSEMMNKYRQADIDAFKAVGLAPKHNSKIWYGAGSRANNFLSQTYWNLEHPKFTGEVFEELQELVPEEIKDYPFAAAFYGGRIEAAMIGEMKRPLYDYDINSAYPYAISLLPKWKETDLVKVEGLDKKHRMGMYLVEWDVEKLNLNFNPFPFRSQNDNVFFPPIGRGWYMSPEVEAAVEIFGKSRIKVIKGYVLKDTEKAGDGLFKLPDSKRCTTAIKIEEMAEYRLIAKDEKEPSEKALKLTINSCYGKLIQQIGSHRYLNPFAAAWITSVCRMKIIRAVRKDTNQETISIMTDGILTTKKLDVELGKHLGQFELSEFRRVIQFMPGIYYLEPSGGGKPVQRYRGMSRDFNPEKAKAYLKGNKLYTIKMRVFVTRTLALHQPNKYGDKRYYFVDVTKEEKFGLGSKRKTPDDFKIKPNKLYRFFPPKEGDWLQIEMGSKPYILNLEPAELAFDTAKTEAEMVDERHIGSILMEEMANG